MKGLTEEDRAELLPSNTFLLAYRGSIAHGTYIHPDCPESVDDKDITGVCIPTLENYFGLKHFEQKEKMLREWDSVVYEVRKFVRLLCKANPNLLSLLWLREQDYIYVDSEFGNRLLEIRDMFTTKQIYYSFTGYAYGQLKRMEHMAFKGYMGDKRKKLVEQFGYDCKNASHLIRLLRMGIEFLREGKLNVYRHDARQLVEIKTGGWPLEKVKEEADCLFKRADAAYDDCKFPSQVDQEKVNVFLTNFLQDWFKVVREE